MLLFMQFHIGYGSGASKRNETQFYWIGSSCFIRKACPLIDRELEQLERGKTSEQNIWFGLKNGEGGTRTLKPFST
jgi:hypothetical protein